MPRIKKQTAKKVRRKSSNVIDRIAPINFDKDGLKVNIYGKSGSGKTTLWATFPKPILAIICSGGAKPGELRSINTPTYRKTIRQVVLEHTEELHELVLFVNATKPYATIVLDHASGLQDMVLKELLGLSELPTQSSWGLASQSQYGQCALQVKTHLRSLLNLSTNVVIVAQEREFNTDTEGTLLMPYVGSALTPSITGWLNPACDYICQTFIRREIREKRVKIAGMESIQKVETGRVEYCLRTGPHDVYTTKMRVPKGTPLPDVIVDPDYDKIKSLIDGEG